MNRSRITQLRIEGMRCIESMSLNLRGLTVLIGDNGSGKSTVLEALELLRQAGKPVNYLSDIPDRGQPLVFGGQPGGAGVNYLPDILYQRHGGLQSLLRRGSKELKLGVTVEGVGPKLKYDFTIAEVGGAPEIADERLSAFANDDAKSSQVLIERDRLKVRFLLSTSPAMVEKQIDRTTLAVAMEGLDDVHPQVERLVNALGAIEIHVPFETRPLWQQQQLRLRFGPRLPTAVDSRQSLARYGENLPNCYQQFRNLGDEVWTRVCERTRLGLGDDFRDFRLSYPTPGHIALEIIHGSAPDQPVPIDSLSEGQISYLAFVALAEFNASRSVLTFDEPELHLHPALLARVVGMLEEVAESCPVVLATHSDRLLDALADPAESVVLCDLDEARRTRLQRPNPERLEEWLETYRGLGSVRAEGYETHVFDGGPALGPAERNR